MPHLPEDLLYVKVEKYRVRQLATGAVVVYRGEQNQDPWMGPGGFPGAKMVLTLAQEIETLRAALESLCSCDAKNCETGPMLDRPHKPSCLLNSIHRP